MAANLQIDEVYEFCAPRFFDFINEETEEQIRSAELWFENSVSDAPSPFMPKIRARRSIQVNGLGSYHDKEKIQEKLEIVEDGNQKGEKESSSGEQHMALQMEVINGKGSFGFAADAKPYQSEHASQAKKSSSAETSFAFPVLHVAADSEVTTNNASRVFSKEDSTGSKVKNLSRSEAFTPKMNNTSRSEAFTPNIHLSMRETKAQTAKKTESKNSSLKPKNIALAHHSNAMKPQKNSAKFPSISGAKNVVSTDIAQENQCIKRQKLDGGRSKLIHNVKNPVLVHKSKTGFYLGNDVLEQTKEIAAPFISAAEMVNKFHSRTRDLELPGPASKDGKASAMQRRAKLTLTRPKEPELQTAQRVRAVRIKSSMELEEEMLAKLPKFKPLPLNKKIFEHPSLPALPRSIPQLPDFQEFHFKTMERAGLHADTASVVSSVDAPSQNQSKSLKLTEPRPPILETALRARPTKIKSSQDLEVEELEKMPKFKARPLNKKIFGSKGDLGVFCQAKPQITTPQEFHFATNDRLGPPPSTMIDFFDKLSIHSESSYHSQQERPRLTKPSPFHLVTEERGFEKERQFTMQILQKQLEEQMARIPKANPYPYTTDFPIMPPKPQPKPCTKPEEFQLESLVRHEEEMQKMMEERERMEREEKERRIFTAQPVMKEDSIPLPERERRPLTEVQEFVLHMDHRAVKRSEFHKKIEEKELNVKRIREEQEHAKLIEEEREIKHMRRTMVPHAKPLPKFDNPFHPLK
ncbi:Protein TPX2 [Apostasia shenzhenica]|uniref:Protein TPX2 n=1 Tax=Apostasia shenzhenica TaxID=1088818 RepID=A0A2I0ARD2_9ASPA|nr:Protein TPX2 [Apostasia shenzhenica]